MRCESHKSYKTRPQSVLTFLALYQLVSWNNATAAHSQRTFIVIVSHLWGNSFDCVTADASASVLRQIKTATTTQRASRESVIGHVSARVTARNTACARLSVRPCVRAPLLAVKDLRRSDDWLVVSLLGAGNWLMTSRDVAYHAPAATNPRTYQ